MYFFNAIAHLKYRICHLIQNSGYRFLKLFPTLGGLWNILNSLTVKRKNQRLPTYSFIALVSKYLVITQKQICHCFSQSLVLWINHYVDCEIIDNPDVSMNTEQLPLITQQQHQIPKQLVNSYGLMVSIPACQAGDPGSNLGNANFYKLPTASHIEYTAGSHPITKVKQC